MKVFRMTRRGASHASHRLHFVFHAMYLTAATLEGHLFYSMMAGGTLLFMIGTELLDRETH